MRLGQRVTLHRRLWATVVVRLRDRLGEDTATFGARFASSPRTVENWEQGRTVPHLLITQRLTALEKKLKKVPESP